jgi:hypothetical protein
MRAIDTLTVAELERLLELTLKKEAIEKEIIALLRRPSKKRAHRNVVPLTETKNKQDPSLVEKVRKTPQPPVKVNLAIDAKRGARGDFTRTMESLLENAPESGLTAPELALRSNKGVQQVRNWLSQTGAKRHGFTRVGYGHYRINTSALDNPTPNEPSEH